MKLYINHPIRYHNFNDLSFLDDINEYICSKDFTNYFYSINGIYKAENDSLYKIQIYDDNDNQHKNQIKKIPFWKISGIIIFSKVQNHQRK